MRVGSVRDLGLIIREARREHGLNQHELADLIGVSRQWVALLETGRGNPGLAGVLEAMQALDLELMAEDRTGAPDGPADLDRLLGGTLGTAGPTGVPPWLRSFGRFCTARRSRRSAGTAGMAALAEHPADQDTRPRA